MDDGLRVITNGCIYVKDGVIVSVRKDGDKPPVGFRKAVVIQTGGTIFPGLIELHNHLSYNVLPLWDVPKRYQHRGQWPGTPLYRRDISGPMNVLGRTKGYSAAIVRYVEAKCLLAGVTTSQGISLSSNKGINRFYKGYVRNVEQPIDKSLPKARTSIRDVDPKKVEKFFADLKRTSCMLLHLSEGKGARARKHFLALQRKDESWAINRALAGIHAAALNRTDFGVMGKKNASIVWSPLSNYLLYGDTAEIASAKAEGVNITLGSDWSPSGSRNLLGELKVAAAVSDHLGGLFTKAELVSLVTRNAAKALRWQKSLGTIEAGKLADLVVISRKSGDPYDRLISATEEDVDLVMISGTARAGRAKLMKKLGKITEEVRVGSKVVALNLDPDGADEIVGKLSLADARKLLATGMRKLPELAKTLERSVASFSPKSFREEAETWYIDLDHEDGETVFALFKKTAAALKEPRKRPLSKSVQPMKLDGLTMSGDNGYRARIRRSRNLPNFLKAAFR